MKKRKIILQILLVLVVSGCNFPKSGKSIYSAEIPFPTSRPWPTASMTPAENQPSETQEAGTSYVDLIRTPMMLENGVYHYRAQSGDTLISVANHFGVRPDQIRSDSMIDSIGVISPGQQLLIPDVLGEIYPSEKLLPDSEVIFSSSSSDFNVRDYVLQAGGYLAEFQQKVGDEQLSGAEIVVRVAADNSINPPRILWLAGRKNHQFPLF